MPSVTYVQPDDTRETAEAANGNSVMLTAVRNGIEGIVAQCNGSRICGTCHVYVEPDQLDLLPPISDEEDALLDEVAAGRQANSRLSCQIKMTPELDGLVVHVPDCQV